MKEKPILMTAENYRKCEDETKGMTRRVITPQPPQNLHDGVWQHTPRGWGYFVGNKKTWPINFYRLGIKCPYPVGTRLWVKEPFAFNFCDYHNNYITGEYKLGGSFAVNLTDKEWENFQNWKNPYQYKSPLFMFKSLARLWLEVMAVRVERLQEISEWVIEFKRI